MGFSIGSYAKLWERKEDDRGHLQIRISTNGKDASGNSVQDFGGWCEVYGKAKDKIAEIADKDTIVLDSITTENKYDRDKGVTYWHTKIFDCHKAPPKTE